MKYPWAVVEQNVTRLTEGIPKTRFGETLPVFGEVYTIRRVEIDRQGNVCATFEEIVNDKHQYDEGFCEMIFQISAFRPVFPQTIADDMKLFEPLLTQHNQDVFIKDYSA